MAKTPEIRKSSLIEELKNFSIGGTAGIIATITILPIDYVKVHLQLMSEGTREKSLTGIQFAKETLKTKGISEFYSGLSSAVLRQAIYATTRLGLYKSLSDREKARTGTSAISFWRKFVYSTIAGAAGAIVGNPCDIALIRVQTDKMLPPEKRRNYKGVFNAIYRIPKEEGLFAYWRGCTPTILRACSMNFGMLAPYDQCKELLDKKLGYGSMNRIYSSLFAAVCACIISLPFDNIKVKYQRMVPDAQGVYPYKGVVDCFYKSIQNEGFLGLYKGFSVYVTRVGPNVIITLLTIDFLHHLLG